MRLIGEEKWNEVLLDANLDPDVIEFLAESKYDPYRRVYRDRKYCYKVIFEGEISSSFRQNDLEQEYMALMKCLGVQGIPIPVKFYKSSMADIMITQYLPGVRLDQSNIADISTWHVMKGLARINYQLAMKGIIQNDMQIDNILISNSGAVYLVDFDQAIDTGRVKALARSFFGINIGGGPVNKSMPGTLLVFVKRKVPGTMKILDKIINTLVNIKRTIFGKRYANDISHNMPPLGEGASDSSKLMFIAWKMAQQSNASSPGRLQAYYALEYQGYLYPGERSWDDRWEALRNITDYSDKRILELGCNMGLLSGYLIKYEGAKESLAVDTDEKIVEAAELINRAMQVKVDYAVVDFDSKDSWEEDLISYKPDLVFALNVLNWVNDKDRFLKFLGSFDALIFEGHDSLEVESKRLKAVGYNKISVVTRTERNREVLFCEKGI